MFPFPPNRLRADLEKMCWRGLTETVWARLADFRSVIIAPPLDTIPSVRGNAIYTLVEELAVGLPEPTLVLARWPEQGSPIKGSISDQVLYDTGQLEPSWLEHRLPYRLKRFLTGSGAPYYFRYARRAAQACAFFNASRIIIEDIPSFAPVVRRHLRADQSLFLHQHIDAFKSVPNHFWHGVVKNLDGVVFVAYETWRDTESLHHKLPIPARVVYNGVNLERFDRQKCSKQALQLRHSLGINSAEKVLLYVGRIVSYKGVAEAVEAFVAASMPDNHFVVVGDVEGSLYGNEDYSRRLRYAAQQLPGKIHLVGMIGQAELPAHYSAADIVIVPSLGHEGLPKVITEALAMQAPCIVTRRGGAPELIQDGINGWIVPEPVTIESIGATIKRAFQELDRVRVLSGTREAMGMPRMIAEFAGFINNPAGSHASRFVNYS
jgi:glycosyltransferase involved in cell wall biosynthesis